MFLLNPTPKKLQQFSFNFTTEIKFCPQLHKSVSGASSTPPSTSNNPVFIPSLMDLLFYCLQYTVIAPFHNKTETPETITVAPPLYGYSIDSFIFTSLKLKAPVWSGPFPESFPRDIELVLHNQCRNISAVQGQLSIHIRTKYRIQRLVCRQYSA